MKKNLEAAEEIICRYRKECAGKPGRSTSLVLTQVKNQKNEGFSLDYAAGRLEISAQSPQGALYGASFAETALKAGHSFEYMGDSSPKFPLRPLWLGGGNCVNLGSRFGISVPAFVSSGKIDILDKMCRRVLELGYNAIIIGNREQFILSPDDEIPVSSLLNLLDVSHQYGIKVIIKVGLTGLEEGKRNRKCPRDPGFREDIQLLMQVLAQKLPTLDYVFWESGLLHSEFHCHTSVRDCTQPELVLEEVKILEEEIRLCPLLFYIPTMDLACARRQAVWMPSLCDDLGPRTILAFPATAGDPTADHQPPHPFWEALRHCREPSYTPIIPILNIGAIKQGEGLWPVLPFDLMDKYLNRCYRHKFAGVIVLTSCLPPRGGLLDCSLWTAAQLMWRDHPTGVLAETWFAAWKKELEYAAHSEVVRNVREIAVDLSLLRSLTNEKSRDAFSTDECRVITESLLARLKEMEVRIGIVDKKIHHKSAKPALSDYFTFFSRDARRIILHFLQCYNVSMFDVLNGGDVGESFWTQVSQGAGQGVRGGTKVSFLETPRKGSEGSMMEKIFLENRLLELS